MNSKSLNFFSNFFVVKTNSSAKFWNGHYNLTDTLYDQIGKHGL